MQKFTIDPGQMIPGPGDRIGQIILEGQDARHLGKVLRLGPGDPVSMTDGQGTDFDGRILSVTPRTVAVEILGKSQSATESSLNLTLCCAMLKDKKMDGVIRELTQLGVTSWVPFYSSRSIPNPDQKKLDRRIERWQSIARESLKQCRRSCEVHIPAPCTFEEVLNLAKDADFRIAFWEDSARPLCLEPVSDSEKAGAIAKAIVLIGPEGGFTEQEMEKAKAKGFLSYTLGPRILRAETAAVTAAALVQYLLGDLGKERSFS